MLFNKTKIGVLLGLLHLTYASENAWSRDVVIVGGGASGAHAAVWLRDHGKSVAVVEKQDTLVSMSRALNKNLIAASSTHFTILTHPRAVTQLFTKIPKPAAQSTSAYKPGWNI
jgi:predicted flavoprotein YhiN